MKNNKKLLYGIIGLFVLILVFFGVYKAFGPKPQKGTKAYTVEVVNSEGKEKQYAGKTDAEFLSGLMDELSAAGDFSYEGSSSEFGLYITAINGEKADFATDGAYWAIIVNGNYGEYGADQQPVSDGDQFTFLYEKTAP